MAALERVVVIELEEALGRRVEVADLNARRVRGVDGPL
jgi:hypothetical protein